MGGEAVVFAGILAVGALACDRKGEKTEPRAVAASPGPAAKPDAARREEPMNDPAKADAPAPPRPLRHADVNHVLATGQSLSVGACGYPALSRKQPYDNLMFASGVIAGSAKLTSFAPLIEGPLLDRSHPNDETMSSAFANFVAQTYRDVFAPEATQKTHPLLVSVHGEGGTPYAGLRRGTGPFAAGVAQVKAALAIATSLRRSYVVRAVTNVHGESDHQAKNGRYAADLAEWQADYERMVKEITQQAEPVPMLHTQVSSWTRYGSATSAIPIAQLAATLASGGKIVLVGPKYHLEYVPDGIHLSNEGYRHMGEDYAKVYRRVILEGGSWEPLRPIAVKRSGAVITVRFAVPAPPLVLDEELVTNPGHHGFELAGSGAPAIVSVTVTGPDTVAIGLAAEPAGGPLRLRYAFSGAVQAHAGPRTGPRGNLRDSDATRSRYGYPLYNWCVHFDEPVAE